MAASLPRHWRLQLGLSCLELVIGRVLPITLWLSTSMHLYLLLANAELKWKSLKWLLMLSIIKTEILGSPFASCVLSIYLVVMMTITPLEEPGEGLPAHAKDLGLSLTRLLKKVENLPLLCLLVAANPIASSFSVFSILDVSTGFQLFFAITKRAIRHTHWKLFSVNLIIAVRALLGPYALHGDLWLGLILLTAAISLWIHGDAAQSRSSLFCTLLGLLGAIHMAIFPDCSPSLLATQISALLLTVALLCFTLSPPLWLVFSGYKWLKLLHINTLVHFLLPLFAIVESEAWSYSNRSL